LGAAVVEAAVFEAAVLGAGVVPADAAGVLPMGFPAAVEPPGNAPEVAIAGEEIYWASKAKNIVICAICVCFISIPRSDSMTLIDGHKGYSRLNKIPIWNPIWNPMNAL
jgi:hypothetical protein